MSREIYRYTFDRAVDMQEVESSLLLAILAVENLHGKPRVRLDAAYCLDDAKRACVIDAHTDVGRDICRIFTGFAIRELGEDAFRVERVEEPPGHKPKEVSA